MLSSSGSTGAPRGGDVCAPPFYIGRARAQTISRLLLAQVELPRASSRLANASRVSAVAGIAHILRISDPEFLVTCLPRYKNDRRYTKTQRCLPVRDQAEGTKGSLLRGRAEHKCTGSFQTIS